MNKKKLEQLINEKKGYITTQDAFNEGIHREYLSMYVKENKLIRVSPGVYQLPDVWDDKLFSFQKRKKKLIYSHETAMYLHGFSDREPFKMNVTLPSGYNTSRLDKNIVETFLIKSDLFELGKDVMKTAYGNEVVVYDIERTICDMIRSKNRMDRQILNDGIKKYMFSNKKNLNRLYNYANKMGIQNVLRDYLELFL